MRPDFVTDVVTRSGIEKTGSPVQKLNRARHLRHSPKFWTGQRENGEFLDSDLMESPDSLAISR